jgi:hypothetical protein
MRENDWIIILNGFFVRALFDHPPRLAGDDRAFFFDKMRTNIRFLRRIQ